MPGQTRKSTSLTLDRALIDEAKARGVNVSRAAEAGIAEAVRQDRAAQWKEDNRDAFDAYDRFVREHGILLPTYRQF